jgi:deazaflavin-dependent oxidoreductase (nitroreductase family)
VTETDWAEVRRQNEVIIDQLRGRSEAGVDLSGRQLLLLTTIGARSGKPHTVPVGYDRAAGSLVVVASKGGLPTNPQWFANLVATPTVTVEIDGEIHAAIAEVPQGAERDRLFEAQVQRQPAFGEYQRNTERLIPVVVLRLTRDG